jgi:hypothetical protein
MERWDGSLDIRYVGYGYLNGVVERARHCTGYINFSSLVQVIFSPLMDSLLFYLKLHSTCSIGDYISSLNKNPFPCSMAITASS